DRNVTGVQTCALPICSKLAPKNESSVCSFGIISIDSNSPGSIAGPVISDFIPSCVNVESVISSSVSLLIKTTKFGWKSRNTVSPPPTTVIIIKTKIYSLKGDVLQIIYYNMLYHNRTTTYRVYKRFRHRKSLFS